MDWDTRSINNKKLINKIKTAEILMHGELWKEKHNLLNRRANTLIKNSRQGWHDIRNEITTISLKYYNSKDIGDSLKKLVFLLNDSEENHTEIKSCIHETIKNYDILISTLGVEVSIKVPAKNLAIDKKDFIRICNNLILNALEHLETVEKGKRILTIKYLENENNAVLLFENSINTKSYAKVKKLLHARTVKRNGLNIVFGLVQKNGGKVKIRTLTYTMRVSIIFSTQTMVV